MCLNQTALDRGDTEQQFKVVDFLGPPPSPELVPALRVALEELDRRTGLARIKHEVRQLVTIAQA